VPLRCFQRRVVTTGLPVGGPGGNLVATELRPEEYIDLLRAKLITARLGARTLSGLIGDVDLPAATVSAGAAWVAENSALSSTDAEWVPVQLRPKHVGAIVEYSRNLLLQSTPDVEMLLRDDFSKSLAIAIDGAALSGGGANEPSGILDQITPTGTASVLWTDVVGLIGTVEGADSEGSGYALAPGVKTILMGKVKLDGATDSAVMMDSPNSLAGYRAESSTGVPLQSMIFGQWSDLVIGYWSVFDFLVNPYETTAYSKGNILVRGMATVDVALRHAESFAALNAIVS